jgi:hypothetical protein
LYEFLISLMWASCPVHLILLVYSLENYQCLFQFLCKVFLPFKL